MATIIDMPKLSDTMTEGTVATWLKNEGDQIESGDVIAEIETDKATMELEAFEDGILIKQIASTGSQIPVDRQSPLSAKRAKNTKRLIPQDPQKPLFPVRIPKRKRAAMSQYLKRNLTPPRI